MRWFFQGRKVIQSFRTPVPQSLLLAFTLAIISLVTGIIVLFFVLPAQARQVELTCLLGEQTEKRGAACEVISIKDRGNVLYASEIPEIYERQGISDLHTEEKFVEVEVKIQDVRNDENKWWLKGVLTFIDDKGDSYTNETDYSPKGFRCDKNICSWHVFRDEENVAYQTEVVEIPKDRTISQVKANLWKDSE